MIGVGPLCVILLKNREHTIVNVNLLLKGTTIQKLHNLFFKNCPLLLMKLFIKLPLCVKEIV